ncbi:PREDICTED: sulfite oxidase-like isoform X2 [Brassica oleracea var. oleracea]|uniref:sulfite oxidase-like isoform X2 n=1 Tax=Brassica oleracea var. oleracea TaxID=109376 RepID=UPI0006A7384C|nr:PREDICTED: sulfite oxidase-like isoform X2 [Brassica oleracea var. oleracea]
MPGIRGPSEYSQEPPRDPCLKVNAKEPFNAEPPRSALVSSYVTPVHLFYKRNHGPIPIVDHIENYSVAVTGLIDNPKMLFIKDIRSLPKYNVTATLQCAGNRRTAMSKVRNVRGVGWDVSAIGNAVWGGAKLADVLELLGIPKLTGFTTLGGSHVEFVSVDRCKEENGGPYKASIPLSQATNPDADVLLAYEMNGEILNRDHGFPLRVVVPGVIGARSVKWLDSINLLAEECQEITKKEKVKEEKIKWNCIQAWIKEITKKEKVKEEKIKWNCIQAWIKVDSAANVQPENVESVWNLRGVLNTSWHRVLLRLGHSNL